MGLATVSGWGTLSSGGNQPTVLNEVDVTVKTNAECQSAYGASAITDNMICAADAGKDSCQGDSGGPLVAPSDNGRYELIGVFLGIWLCHGTISWCLCQSDSADD